MAVKIQKYINTSDEDIRLKARNIFIGISLGNKYFSGANVREFILWGLENTKDDILVVVADAIHAINYEVLNGYSPERAMSVALRKGDEKRKEIEAAIADLREDEKAKVKIVGWQAVRKSPSYEENIRTIQDEFAQNPDFRKYILGIISENAGERSSSLDDSCKERLAEYVLDELPPLFSGIEHEGRMYDLHPYPGLSSFDCLLEGLGNKTLFPELAAKISFNNKPAIVEMFVV